MKIEFSEATIRALWWIFGLSGTLNFILHYLKVSKNSAYDLICGNFYLGSVLNIWNGHFLIAINIVTANLNASFWDECFDLMLIWPQFICIFCVVGIIRLLYNSGFPRLISFSLLMIRTQPRKIYFFLKSDVLIRSRISSLYSLYMLISDTNTPLYELLCLLFDIIF